MVSGKKIFSNGAKSKYVRVVLLSDNERVNEEVVKVKMDNGINVSVNLGMYCGPDSKYGDVATYTVRVEDVGDETINITDMED